MALGESEDRRQLWRSSASGSGLCGQRQGGAAADLRYAKIESDVSLDGAGIGKVEIDPLVTGISYVVKF